MRYQEKVYVNDKNRAVNNVKMSSDFCIFKSPKYGITGTTKVQCGGITCNLSGFSSTNILSAATYDCFTTNSMSGQCFSSVTWTTKIYEDNKLTYSGSYYTSYSLTGDTPNDEYFFTSLTDGLSILGYAYTLEDRLLSVKKPYGGTKELQYDLCLTWGIKPTALSCPAGYTATPANDSCQKISVSAATPNGLGSVIITGDTDAAYATYGTFFYPSIQNLDESALPLYYIGSLSDLRNQSGGTITATNIVNSSNTFWWNDGAGAGKINGRLNNVGLSGSPNEYLGFSKCIDIISAGTYYVGVGGDNFSKVTIDSKLYIHFSSSTSTDNFRKWSVFPFYFTSGLHIIEMVGQNSGSGSASAFGAEIYYPTGATPFATLTAATSTASTQANVIFSTEEFVGLNWQIGTTVGYKCTGDYAPNFCDPFNPICTKILNAPISGITCTGVCSGTCTTICNDTFPYVDNNSEGVYISSGDSTTQTIPLTFNFTSDTSSFTANSASFKYKIYKYTPETGVFKLPPVYESRAIPYFQFSSNTGTSLVQSIALSGINSDGDYLIKGFFEANPCTDYLNKLGKRLDTTVNYQGSVGQVYQSDLDHYFISIRKSDIPYFTYSLEDERILPTEGVSLYQQIIIVDDVKAPPGVINPNTPYPSSPQSYTGPPYYRTGSTFVLSNEYAGDVVTTLNGLTLAKDVDYTLTGQTLTLLGPVTNGDIITIIYTRTNNRTIVGDSIYINTVIPSGSTNNQANNKYYYNTTTGKYEIYTNNTPFSGTKIIVILNGITLADNIDYYQSTSDPKRIILIGDLMIGDSITVVYYPTVTVINGITTTNNYISWYITNPPAKPNGTFYLEYSTTPSFLTYTISDTVPYAELTTNYNGVLTLTGSVGTNYYYRVRSVKNYVSVCGDIISSTGYSESVKVQIQNNFINSY